jgi:hypothetical protein
MIEVKLLIDIYLWTCCLVQNACIIFHAEQHTKQSNYLSGADAQSFALDYSGYNNESIL